MAKELKHCKSCNQMTNHIVFRDISQCKKCGGFTDYPKQDDKYALFRLANRQIDKKDKEIRHLKDMIKAMVSIFKDASTYKNTKDKIMFLVKDLDLNEVGNNDK